MKNQTEIKSLPGSPHIGTRSKALAYALSANLKHNGIRYTNADKRRAVGLALADPELSGKSDEVIGRLCGVSDRSVNRARSALRSDNVGPEQAQTRTGKDGKQYPVKPRKPKPEAKIEPPPQPSDTTPTDHVPNPTDMVDDSAHDAPEQDQVEPAESANPTPPDRPPVVAEPTAGPITVERASKLILGKKRQTG